MDDSNTDAVSPMIRKDYIFDRAEVSIGVVESKIIDAESKIRDLHEYIEHNKGKIEAYEAVKKWVQ